MNILLYLSWKFFSQQKTNTTILVILSLVLSFFYTNISSLVNANIIQAIQKNDLLTATTYFKYFVAVSFVFILTYYIYKNVQNNLLTTLAHWTKAEMFNFILLSNNINMSNVNFVEFITPITRISNSCNMLLSDIISNVIPTLGFLIVIVGYFLYKDVKLGLGVLFGSILICLYFVYYWRDMFVYKQKQEDIVVGNEKYIIDSLNNIDKIIYRGQVENEINIFNKKTTDCTEYTIDMMNFMTNHSFTMNLLVYFVIFGALWHMIQMHFNKSMDAKTFITFLSILMMYRDDISGTIQRVPTYIESIGRIEMILREFEKMTGVESSSSLSSSSSSLKDDEIKDMIDQKNRYKTIELAFDRLSFQNVSFKYSNRDQTIFDNYNKELVLNDKIIGITGLSGNGKSSFVKLIMRLHSCSSGAILIDGQDINTIDPFYIRQNITYVNQNSRLFDRKIMDNILYGCKDISLCNENLREILAYSKIQELYKNIDISTMDAGPLGENLSGGQRQIINIISGLVNPTKILILDEPTNALDPELKREVLGILKNFRKYKKCIMIITHDRDVYSLFDETLEI